MSIQHQWSSPTRRTDFSAPLEDSFLSQRKGVRNLCAHCHLQLEEPGSISGAQGSDAKTRPCGLPISWPALHQPPRHSCILFLNLLWPLALLGSQVCDRMLRMFHGPRNRVVPSEQRIWIFNKSSSFIIWLKFLCNLLNYDREMLMNFAATVALLRFYNWVFALQETFDRLKSMPVISSLWNVDFTNTKYPPFHCLLLLTFTSLWLIWYEYFYPIFFHSAGDWTQELIHTKQEELYHWTTSLAF